MTTFVDMTDNMDDLLRIAKDDPNYIQRERVLSAIYDEEFLYEIATSDGIPSVRITATRKLSNPEYLMKIAKEDSNSEVRVIATKMIRDDRRLFNLWKIHSKDWWLRTVITRKIEQEDYLETIALQDTNFYVKKEAVQRIKKQDKLFNIVVNCWDTHPDTAKVAFGRIIDPQLLQTLRIMTSGDISADIGKRIRNIRKIMEKQTE